MWLQNVGAKSSFNLRRLAVSDTNCDVFGLMQAARIGILKTLMELDVSGNKIDKAGATALAVALKGKRERKKKKKESERYYNYIHCF